MDKLAIIGAGRVGATLGKALQNSGYAIAALSCRTLSSAEESHRILGEGTYSTDNIRTAKAGTLLMISVTDREISPVIDKLKAADIVWKKRKVFHCSGLLPTSLLDPLQHKGALVASLHPVQSFPHKSSNPDYLKDVYFSIEGSPQAVEFFGRIAALLGGRPFPIREKDKPLYHAACSIASNDFVALLKTAAELMAQAGLSEQEAIQALYPLVRQTLENIKSLGPSSALTGPVVRGDTEILRRQFEGLKNWPFPLALHKMLGTKAAEMVKEKGILSEEKMKKIRALLEDK